MAGRSHAFPFRAALSPAAKKGTDTTATAAPRPPAHAGDHTLLLLPVVVRVPSRALRVPHASTQSMPGGTLCRAGSRASACELPMCATEHSCGTKVYGSWKRYGISPISMGVLRVTQCEYYVSTRSPDLSHSSTECE
jgi:hypothetical protein